MSRGARSVGSAVLATISLATSGPALADRLPMPADAPPSYAAECGGCHLAFPPALLAAGDWRRVMAQLREHYGTDASVSDKLDRELSAFLVREAGSLARLGGAGDPPRLTGTNWFRREHRKVGPEVWRDPRVKSAANCAACHPGAEQGSYRERELRVPGYSRRDER